MAIQATTSSAQIDADFSVRPPITYLCLPPELVLISLQELRLFAQALKAADAHAKEFGGYQSSSEGEDIAE